MKFLRAFITLSYKQLFPCNMNSYKVFFQLFHLIRWISLFLQIHFFPPFLLELNAPFVFLHCVLDFPYFTCNLIPVLPDVNWHCFSSRKIFETKPLYYAVWFDSGQKLSLWKCICLTIPLRLAVPGLLVPLWIFCLSWFIWNNLWRT